MITKDDGGPAFPLQDWDPCIQSRRFETGMSLRDYFAIHATQPGVVEIAKAAGVGVDENLRVYQDADSSGMRFEAWWISLTLARQSELSAMARYSQADAMLKERTK